MCVCVCIYIYIYIYIYIRDNQRLAVQCALSDSNARRGGEDLPLRRAFKSLLIIFAGLFHGHLPSYRQVKTSIALK